MENTKLYNLTIELSFRDIFCDNYEVDKENRKQLFESLEDVIRKFSRDSGYVVIKKQISESINRPIKELHQKE